MKIFKKFSNPKAFSDFARTFSRFYVLQGDTTNFSSNKYQTEQWSKLYTNIIGQVVNTW
jgi:hypothetical protein